MSSPMQGFMSEIRPSRVSLVKRPANKREYLLIKSEDEMDEIFRIISETEAENETELVEALKAADKDEKTIEAALAVARVFSAYSEDITKPDFEMIAKSLGFETAEKEDETEEITKSDLEALPEAIRNKVEKLQSESEATNERLTEIEKSLSDQDEVTKLAEWKEKVSDLDNVAKSADELAVIAKGVADSSGDEAAEAFIEALRSANSTKSEDFEEDGSSAPGDESNEDAYELAKAKAEKIVEAENVTFHKAMQLVAERHPELANRYSEEL
jgi:hypothetical protein